MRLEAKRTLSLGVVATAEQPLVVPGAEDLWLLPTTWPPACNGDRRGPGAYVLHYSREVKAQCDDC